MHLYIAGMEVMTMRKILAILLMTGALAIGIGSGQQKDQSEVNLQAAIRMETVEGDLKGAIEAYKKIAEAGNRAVAAKALIRMGQCYEKLGDAEARKAYERVVREFFDQKEAVEQARALLAASTRDRPTESGLAFQRKGVLSPAAVAGGLSRHPSPDGRYIFFQTTGCLWQRDLTTGEDRRLIQGQPCESVGSTPEVSPDGKQIAYTRRIVKGDVPSYELWVAGIDGSGVKLVMNDKERRLSPKGWFSPKGWSPDAKHILIVVYSDMTGLQGVSLALVSVTDGSVRAVGAQDDFSFGSFSPDGKYLVAYSLSRREGQLEPVPGRLKLIPVDGSREIPLFESPAKTWAPLWTPDGRMILFLSDRSGTTDLWSIRMSGAKPEGEPELVKREVDPISLLGFTRDGSLYFHTSTFQSDIYTVDLDPATGRVISKPAQFNQRFVGSVGHPMAWSRDGQFLAYARTSRRKVISFIVRSEKTGEEREIAPVPAFSKGYPKTLIWLSDGRSFLADDFGKELFFHQIDIQTGQAKVFVTLSGSDKKYFPVLSPDEKALFYVQYAPYVKGAPYQCGLMRRDMASGEIRDLFPTEDVQLEPLALSPDGRQLAFAINAWAESKEQQDTFALMIMPSEGGAARELLRSKRYIGALTWTPDGRHVLMMRESESGPDQQFGPYQLWSVPVGGGESQPLGLVKPGGFAVSADVSLHPDGRRIAFINSKEPQEEVWGIKNLLSTPKTSR